MMVSCLKRFIFAFCILAIPFYGYAQVRQSKAIPENSPRLSVRSSEYSLADPRVALRKIDQALEKKDVSKVKSLIQAYKENSSRPDGYGPAIQIRILQTLTQIKSPQAVPFLLGEFQASHDARYKDEMTLALKEIGDPKALPYLKSYADYLQAREPDDPLIRTQWQRVYQHVLEAIKKLEAAQ